MKKIFIISSYLLISSYCFCQNAIWSQHFGSNNFDISHGKCTQNGDFITFGRFDGSTLNTQIDTISQTINGDLFISYIRDDGTINWIKQINNSSLNPSCLAYFSDLVLDDTNQVFYVSGIFCNNLTIDTFHIFSQNNYDIFIAKMDYFGNCKWIKKMTGNGDDYSTSMILLNQNTIFINGRTKGILNFDTLACNAGAFLSTFDSSGSAIMLKQISPYIFGEFSFMPGKMVLSFQSILMCGDGLSDTTMIDGLNIAHLGYTTNIISKFNSSGDIVWAKPLKCPNSGPFSGSILWSFITDNIGNIYLAGMFTDSLVFENAILSTDLGLTDMYVMKLDSNANIIWNKQFYSHNNSLISDIVFVANKIYITGILGDTATFDSYQAIPSSTKEYFISQMDSSGICEVIFNKGEIEGSFLDHDANGNIFNIIIFYNNFATNLNSNLSYGSADILIAKYNSLTDIAEPERFSNQLLIYTNPSLGQSNIRMPAQLIGNRNILMTIYSVDGKIVQSQRINMLSEVIEIDISDEAKGIYNISLQDGNKLYSGKIIFE